MTGIEAFMQKTIEKPDCPLTTDELSEQKELPKDIETGEKTVIEPPDISFIERTSRTALMEQCSLSVSQTGDIDKTSTSETSETKSEGLTEEEKAKIKEETGWSDEIIDNIQNMKQYEILKNAGLIEVEINGRKCLIKENIDLDYTDEDGVSNRDRIARGLAPLDSKTGKPIELHHLGQKADSPLVELTEEEHRTGEYEDGKKNQSLWHDNTKETEVHGEGNSWDQERKAHWKARAENSEG
jgi:hypothetical protein